MVKYTGKTAGSPLATLGTSGGAIADTPYFGISVLTSAADIWTLEKPVVGCLKIITGLAAGTSNSRIIRLSTASSGDSVTLVQGGTSGVAATEIAVNTTDSFSIGLIGLSSNQWKTAWVTTGHSAPTTGIVFQVS